MKISDKKKTRIMAIHGALCCIYEPTVPSKKVDVIGAIHRYISLKSLALLAYQSHDFQLLYAMYKANKSVSGLYSCGMEPIIPMPDGFGMSQVASELVPMANRIASDYMDKCKFDHLISMGLRLGINLVERVVDSKDGWGELFTPRYMMKHATKEWRRLLARYDASFEDLDAFIYVHCDYVDSYEMQSESTWKSPFAESVDISLPRGKPFTTKLRRVMRLPKIEGRQVFEEKGSSIDSNDGEKPFEYYEKDHAKPNEPN